MAFNKLVLVMTVFCLSSCGSKVSEIPVDSQVVGVNFVGMTVSDIERSSEVLQSSVDLTDMGFASPPWRESESLLFGDISSSPIESKMLRSSNAQILLMEFEGKKTSHATPINGPGIAHVCYQVDAKTQSYQRFLKLGVSTVGHPEMVQLREGNPVSYAYALDHDGIAFEVEHVEVDKLDLPTPPKHQYRIRHVSLATTDMARSIAFYAQLLEQPNPRRAGRFWNLRGEKLDMISGLRDSKIEMAWFQTRNLELEIIQYHNPQPAVPPQPRKVEDLGYNMIVFDVKDLDAAHDLLVSAGGEVVNSHAEILGNRILFARDPDNNLIGFQAAPSSSVVSSQNFRDNGI